MAGGAAAVTAGLLLCSSAFLPPTVLAAPVHVGRVAIRDKMTMERPGNVQSDLQHPQQLHEQQHSDMLHLGEPYGDISSEVRY